MNQRRRNPMSVYFVYDSSTGEILHIHREIMAESDKTVQLSDQQVMEEIKALLPLKTKTKVAVADEYPNPVRGYTYYIDLNTGKLMMIENRAKKRSKKK
jgi:hypothetical protein